MPRLGAKNLVVHHSIVIIVSIIFFYQYLFFHHFPTLCQRYTWHFWANISRLTKRFFNLVRELIVSVPHKLQ